MAFLYSLDRDGKIVIREGTALKPRIKGDRRLFLTRDTGYRIVIDKHPGVMHNAMMWSPTKWTYLRRFYEEMVEIMIDEEQHYMSKISISTKRRHNLHLTYEDLYSKSHGGPDR